MSNSHNRMTILQSMMAWLLIFFSQTALSAAEEYRLTPKTDSALPSGKFAAVQGTVGSMGQKFILGDLSILQPVDVTLLSAEPNADLSLQLSKFDWETAERKGSTKETGSQSFQIRTEGDLRILVSSAQGEKPYQLAVWVGDEIHSPMTPVFVPKENFKGKSVGDADPSSPLLWMIAVLLAAILMVLLAFLLRGRKS